MRISKKRKNIRQRARRNAEKKSKRQRAQKRKSGSKLPHSKSSEEEKVVRRGCGEGGVAEEGVEEGLAVSGEEGEETE